MQGRRAALTHPAGQRRLGQGGASRLCPGGAEACDLGANLSTRARQLIEVAPKLRAKGSAEVVTLLLEDDALPGGGRAPNSRGARRGGLFE
ncbi:DUF1403 family protein [Mesorhizobium sp. CA8]|uniref:DUF1403 family protein n=1 Tax=Mesorhizobium sp. CA8 TaxID=2876637 RepID=UPI001CCE3189|nr:DUF1403 family protein [Mesorhizobium sp. CA8]